MDVAIHLRDFIDDPTRPMEEQIEEAAEVTRRAKSLGFSGIYVPQHWISHPTIWLQPLLVLARLAPEAKEINLITGVILVPMHNPVDLAEQVITMDHISQGRLIFGVVLGYRQTELEAFGTNRGERVARFEESLELMKRLWSGELVNFEGRFWQVHDARVAVAPVQKPYPPIWIAGQSESAVRRAAAVGDGCLLGPQQSWHAISHLPEVYWDALSSQDTPTSGLLGANRSITIARDRHTAIHDAEAAAQRRAKMYGGWSMQERGTVDLGLSGSRELAEWAIVGGPQECVETLSRAYFEQGLRYVGLGFLNLPAGQSARLDYLQFISEELLTHLP